MSQHTSSDADSDSLEYTDQQLEQSGLTRAHLPRHVAIIMDGNGRWAQARKLPRIEGHRRGVNSVRTVVTECCRLGLEQLTLFCFSSENWKRPRIELNLLMSLLETYVIRERPEIMRQDIQFSIIGRREGLGEKVLSEVQRTIDQSVDNQGMRLCLALNYGSRTELVDACRSISAKVVSGELVAGDITEQTISDHLYTSGMADPDLVIRTAGEMRISNFLLWQISYAELWVTDKCWPDFDTQQLFAAIQDFALRDRRFGGLKG